MLAEHDQRGWPVELEDLCNSYEQIRDEQRDRHHRDY